MGDISNWKSPIIEPKKKKFKVLESPSWVKNPIRIKVRKNIKPSKKP